MQHGTHFILRRQVGNSDEDETAIFELLDARTKKPVQRFEYEIRLYDADDYHGSAIARMSENESVIVTIAGDANPLVWSPSSSKPIAELDGMGEAGNVFVSPKGDRALVKYEQAYALYSLPDGKKLAGEWLRPEQTCEGVSPGFDRVIVSQKERATVRDVFDGHVIGEAAYHSSYIRAARFSDDGRAYCTLSRDGTARVWDAASGYPLTEPLVFNPAPPHFRGGPVWEDDYSMQLDTPVFAGRRVSFPDPEAGRSREFAWEVSLAMDSTTAGRLSELATLLFGARIGASGAVEPVIAPEAHELAARFKDSALAPLARRAVERAASTRAVAATATSASR